MHDARIKFGVIYFPVEPCAGCGVSTSERYSRTMKGKSYCLECIKKGAGLDDLVADGLGGYITEEDRKNAAANSFYVPPLPSQAQLNFNEPY